MTFKLIKFMSYLWHSKHQPQTEALGHLVCSIRGWKEQSKEGGDTHPPWAVVLCLHPPHFQPWKWQLPFLYLTINKQQGSSEPRHIKMLGQKAENRVKWVRGTNFLSKWQFYPLLKRKRQEWNMPNETTKPLKRPRKIGCLTSGLQIKVEQSCTCCRLVLLSLLMMTKMFIIH